MTEEFLESEILFSDDFDSDQTFLDAKYHRKSHNEIRFYYGHVDEFSENREHSHSYKSTKREDDKEEAGVVKRKSSSTSPIEIPWKASNRSRTDKRETEFEDRECFFMPPHEILARRFANKRMPLPCNFQA